MPYDKKLPLSEGKMLGTMKGSAPSGHPVAGPPSPQSRQTCGICVHYGICGWMSGVSVDRDCCVYQPSKFHRAENVLLKNRVFNPPTTGYEPEPDEFADEFNGRTP